jgi:hypothetical protein
MSYALVFLLLFIAPKMAEGVKKINWYKISKIKVKQLTITLGYLWAVNNAGHVFMCARPCSKNNWQRVPGCLKQIEAGDMEVWGVANDGTIWKRPVNAYRGSWTYVPGRMKQVSASGNGHIWGVNAYNRVYMCKKPCYGHWNHISGAMKQVDGGYAYVYAINPSNQVYRRKIDGSGSWYHISGSYMQITGSAKNHVYAIDPSVSHYLYKCKKPCTGSWSLFYYINIKYVDGALDALGLIHYGRSAKNYIYVYELPLT